MAGNECESRGVRRERSAAGDGMSDNRVEEEGS